jgi:hypothetical protein
MYKQPSIGRPTESLPGSPPQIGKKCCAYRNEDDSCQSLRYDCVNGNQVCPDRIDCWVKIREVEVSDCQCCGEITNKTKKN